MVLVCHRFDVERICQRNCLERLARVCIAAKVCDARSSFSWYDFLVRIDLGLRRLGRAIVRSIISIASVLLKILAFRVRRWNRSVEALQLLRFPHRLVCLFGRLVRRL